MLVASIFSSNWPASSPSAQPHGSVHARCRLCFDDILYSSHGQQNKHIRWCPIYVLCAPMCTTPVRSPSATLLVSWWQWMVVVVAGREMYVTDIDYYIWSTSSAMLPSFTVGFHVLLLCTCPLLLPASPCTREMSCQVESAGCRKMFLRNFESILINFKHFHEFKEYGFSFKILLPSNTKVFNWVLSRMLQSICIYIPWKVITVKHFPHSCTPWRQWRAKWDPIKPIMLQ